MSNAFEKFSEATRLYARYALVVDEMYEIYLRDLCAFADTLANRVGSLVPEGQFQKETSGANRRYRYWCLYDGTDDDEEQVSYVWVDTQDGRLVVPGAMHLTVEIDDKDEARRRQVAALQHELSLPDHCRVLKGEYGGLFTIAISYGDGDPVAAAEGPVLTVLRALYETDKKVLATNPPRPASKKRDVAR